MRALQALLLTTFILFCSACGSTPSSSPSGPGPGPDGQDGGADATSSSPGADGGPGVSPGSADGGSADAKAASPPCQTPTLAPSPVSFPLPSGFVGASDAGAFGTIALGNGPYCDTNRNVPNYSVLDVNGDGKPDLVLTDVCGDTAVGFTYWSVILNDGTGFGGAPTHYALPPGYFNVPGTPTFGMIAAQSGPYCASDRNVPNYTVLDANGDGKPDLVVTADCADSKVGLAYWSVFLNDGTGFAATPTHFALPAGFANAPGTGAFGTIALANGPYCDTDRNVPNYAVLDANGDGKPDLVLTDVCNDTGVGFTYWSVYLNDGTGFAASPVHFALPAGFTNVPGTPTFATIALANGPYCDTNRSVPNYAVLDANGDGKPDLVLTDVCNDTGVGFTYWSVYLNDGTGFAASPAHFALPAGFTNVPGTATFSTIALANGPYCDTHRNVPNYWVLDANGDARPDLVLTDVCNDTGVGFTYWSIYLNDGTGFAASPTHFALPAGYFEAPGTPPFGMTGSSGGPYCATDRDRPNYSVLDINGDAKPDFVVTADCKNAQVGLSSWLVFEGTCGP